MTHKELVEIAYKWVLKNGSCGVAFKELNTSCSNSEYPDVIGFGSHSHSVLLECKTTYGDFIADKRKAFRKDMSLGMGKFRIYVAPKGLIPKDELPEKWGLIEVDEKNRAAIVVNCLKLYDWKKQETYENFFSQNIKAEHELMYSALRRLFIKGCVKYIYDKDYNKSTTPDELILLNTFLKPPPPCQ